MNDTRHVTLKCGVCGGTNFEYNDDLYKSIEEAEILTCTRCNKIYTKQELLEVNTSLINNEAKEIAKELIEKKLKKTGLHYKIK